MVGFIDCRGYYFNYVCNFVVGYEFCVDFLIGVCVNEVVSNFFVIWE